MHEAIWLLGSAVLGGAVSCATWAFVSSRTAKARSTPADGVLSGGASTVPRLVTMPHPDWTPGTKQPHPFSTDNWIPYDPIVEEKSAVYPLVISSVVPRPIALISSCNAEGVVNLAPYSYFNAVSNDPVTVIIAISRAPERGGGKKDTLMNIEATGEFVINIMSEWYVEAANHSCGDFDHGVNEMELAGLTALPSHKVKAPRLKESALHMECQLRQVTDIPDGSGKPSMAVVLAEVVMVHVHEGVASKSPTGKLVVDPIKLQPVYRLGGTLYGRVNQMFDIGRPVKAQAHLGPAQYTASYQAALQSEQ